MADTVQQLGTLTGMGPQLLRRTAEDHSERKKNWQHALNEFTAGVSLMMEQSGATGEVSREMSAIVERLIENVQQSGPVKNPPVLNFVAAVVLALLPTTVGLAYWAGTLSNRIAQVETLAPRVMEIERKTEGVQVLAAKIDALQRDIDRLLPNSVSPKR